MKYPLFAIVIAVLSMGCKEASFNPSQRVQTSALTLNLYCIGAGETTVLLLPGLSGKSSNWTEVIASQPLNNKVCALDFSPTAALIAGNDVVSAAITALQQEGISENIVLVAHSFGKNKGIKRNKWDRHSLRMHPQSVSWISAHNLHILSVRPS